MNSKKNLIKIAYSLDFLRKFEESAYFQQKSIKSTFCDSYVIKKSLWRQMKVCWYFLV